MYRALRGALYFAIRILHLYINSSKQALREGGKDARENL
jgi:hypothetical protein